MNAEQGNHGKFLRKHLIAYFTADSDPDPTFYGSDSNEFYPERWLENDKLSKASLPHYGYGAGAR